MKLFNRDSGGRFSTLTKRMEPIAKKMGVMFAVYTVLFTGAYVGYSHSTVIVNQVEAETKPIEKVVPPILQRIAHCESKTGQYKDGQVTINATQDIGKYQINLPTWAKTATKMGLDLSKEKDNETFAIWLFENKGSDPWKSSQACWSK